MLLFKRDNFFLISNSFIIQACNREEAVRYLLWIRLSRALRVTEFFEGLEKDIRINYLFTRIIKLFVVELYATHTAASIFYYLATTLPPAKEGYTWIGSLKMGDYNYSQFRDIDLWTRYITSLYFAIVTMATVGQRHLLPFFIIIIILFIILMIPFIFHICCFRLWRYTCCQQSGNGIHNHLYFR